MLLLAGVPSFIVGLEGIGDPTTVTTDVGVLALLAAVASAAGLAVMAVYLLWRDGRLASSGFARRDPAFVAGYGALGWVACFLTLLLLAFVATAVYAAAGGDLEALGEGNEDVVALTAGSLVVAAVLSLTAGVTEEIVFRAYAITRLEELGWRRAALVVPGAVFTLLHLYQGVLAVLFIGGITAVLTWLYRWRRSVWPVMVAHALYDATVLTIAALAG